MMVTQAIFELSGLWTDLPILMPVLSSLALAEPPSAAGRELVGPPLGANFAARTLPAVAVMPS